MLNQFRAILFYYRPLALWSFATTIILLIFSSGILAALLTKLFLIILFSLMISDKGIRRKLRFYKMVGVSNFKLLTILYLIDCFFTCSFLFLIKGFI